MACIIRKGIAGAAEEEARGQRRGGSDGFGIAPASALSIFYGKGLSVRRLEKRESLSIDRKDTFRYDEFIIGRKFIVPAIISTVFCSFCKCFRV